MHVIKKQNMTREFAGDLRDKIFASIEEKKFKAHILADDAGIIAGTDGAAINSQKLGLSLESIQKEGATVNKGDEIVRFSGSPKQVAMAEDILIGLIAKPSGIATAVNKFIHKAGPNLKVVSGTWKKMPEPLKEITRRAISVGGGFYRISDQPFLYLDKNYVSMLGGIRECLLAVSNMTGYVKVVQLKGRYKDIAAEAYDAASNGGDILYIDTGKREDIQKVTEKLCTTGLRDRVKVAFGGGLKLEDVDALKVMDVDIIGIGRQIVDAPLLDMRLEIIGIKS
jgi:nicotinate-nucleotide pyrophosphorylase (carboxylating)